MGSERKRKRKTDSIAICAILTYLVFSDAEVQIACLVISQAGCVEDIIRDGEVDHSVVLLRKTHGRSMERNWGVVTGVKKFSLMRERELFIVWSGLAW